MRIFLSLTLVLFSAKIFAACDFKSHITGVVSLSGPSTVLLKELGLLTHKKLKGISVFNPIGENEFGGKIYPGGVFLSQNTFGEFSGSVVFYDESRELKRVLSPMSSIQGIEIKTRNLTPYESVTKTLETMKPFLTSCEKEMSTVEAKVKSLEKKLLRKIPQNLSVIFYLGEFRGNRPPELVIVQDGVVKWLIEKKKIKTYPSELAYVNWSAKILNSFPATTLHVGIKDPAREMKKEIKRSPRGMTLIYPGSLVPGITQLEAFLYWAETL